MSPLPFESLSRPPIPPHRSSQSTVVTCLSEANWPVSNHLGSISLLTNNVMISSGELCLSLCASPGAQTVKNLPAMRETQVRSLSQEDPLEKEMATRSSIVAWRIPWREEPGKLQSLGSQRVRNNWATNTFTFIACHLIWVVNYGALSLYKLKRTPETLTNHTFSWLIKDMMQKHDTSDRNWPLFLSTLRCEHNALSTEETEWDDSSSESLRAIMSDNLYFEIP